MFGAGGRAARPGAAGNPRAPPPRRQHLLSRSESIKKKAPPTARHQLLIFSKSDSMKKRSGASAAKGSKRARLRAGLAAALQELRLAGHRRHRRGSSPMPAAGADTRAARLGDEPQVGLQLQLAAHRSADDAAGPEGETATGGGGGGALLVVLLLLALLCVVALGRAPAVCCCTCAAWWCRGTSAASATVRHQALPPEGSGALCK